MMRVAIKNHLNEERRKAAIIKTIKNSGPRESINSSVESFLKGFSNKKRNESILEIF